MASWIISLFRFIWPSNISSDLSASRKLVQPLPLHPSTKHFVLALRDPEHPESVVYILATVILSERSASDARDLIKALNPRAVIAQVGSDALEAIQTEQLNSVISTAFDRFPTSPLHVIKESFLDGANRLKYEKMAAAEVTRAIFGTSFIGRVEAAKEAAAGLNSSFYYLETPFNSLEGEESNGEANEQKERSDTAGSFSKSLAGSLQLMSSLSGFPVESASKTLISGLDTSPLNFAVSHVTSLLQYSLATKLSAAGIGEGSMLVDHGREAGIGEGSTLVDRDPDVKFECPTFAHSFYPLLADLHRVYKGLPGMNIALDRTQKVLRDVDKGRDVDPSELALSQCFRLAVEGLRVALNHTAQSPLELVKPASGKVNFDDLPYEEKCYVLLAQALKQQAQKSQTVVAILDAGSVAGIRKHWTTPVPDHVAVLAKECLVSEEDEDAEINSEGLRRKGKLLDKPIVVVGAGAAAAVGLASFPHLAPVSTAMKILTLKIPTIVKLGLMQTKRNAVGAVAKLVTPVTKLLVPAAKGFAPAKVVLGSKASALKAATGTGKIRVAAHSVIALAEKTSLSAMRTAFYNAMRDRQRKKAGGRSWLSFGASVTVCAGLLTFGDGIENVIEAIPEAPSIARLGCGIKSLCHASETLKQAESAHYWDSMYRRLYGLWNGKN